MDRPTSAADDSALDALVIEYLERRERIGDRALEEICAAAPDVAAELRARVANLRAAGLLEGSGAVETFPPVLGDFELDGRIGAGGMGIVYRARQTSLQRRVALKLIRPEHLYFPGARERFGREVQVVARLSHPGIAAVYSVGQHAGVPFFAMELIDGKSLADVLEACRGAAQERRTGRDLSPGAPADDHAVFSGTWVQACLRVARQVAEALEYAHREGVVHRDVKPSNIMLTASGRAMLVDFGLARTEGSDPLTRSGSAIGSAPYMPPEVVVGRGGESDVRADVYSLGVTLYEMLTLRAPFAGDTRDAILRAVLDARPPRPRALWKAIPVDVETVCLLAMDRDPARRYPSAEAFARDLTNVLELRPIEARPLPFALRARRWAQRNPARAVAVVLAVLLVVGGPVAFGVQQALARARLAEVLADRSAALALAEENFAAAGEAVEYMLDRVGDETLAGIPHMETVRSDLLHRALEFYQRFLDQRAEDPAVLRRMASAYHRVGVIHTYLQEHTAAQEAFRGGLGVWRELRRSDDSAGVRTGLAQALCDLTAQLSDARLFEEAEPLWEEAREVLAGRVDAGDREAEKAAANLWRVHGVLRERQSRMEDAGASYARAIDAYRALHGAAPDPAMAHQLAYCEIRRASCLAQDPDAAEALLRSAIETLDALCAQDPDKLAFQRELGSALEGLGWLLSLRSRDGADVPLRRALAVREKLAADYPRANALQRHAYIALDHLGDHFLRMGRSDEAEETYLRLIAFQREVVKRNPDGADARVLLGSALHNLGAVRYKDRRWEEALPLFEEAACVRRQVLESAPDDAETRRDLTDSLSSQLWVFQRLHQHRGTAAAAAEIERVAADALSSAALQDLGQALSRCVVWVRVDDSAPEAEREAAAATYAARAIDLWLRAVAKGADRDALAGLPELEHVRGTAQWARLADELGLEK